MADLLITTRSCVSTPGRKLLSQWSKQTCPNSSWIPRRAYSAPVDAQIPESKQQYVPTSGTYPKGFRVSGTHVGVKASNKILPDLALIVSGKPCTAAAIFTRNKFQAAPVTISKRILQEKQNKDIKSIIINSGCANAVTGKGGLEDAASMAAALEQSENNESSNDSLVMSTGKLNRDPQRCSLNPHFHSNIISVEFMAYPQSLMDLVVLPVNC